MNMYNGKFQMSLSTYKITALSNSKIVGQYMVSG